MSDVEVFRNSLGRLVVKTTGGAFSLYESTASDRGWAISAWQRRDGRPFDEDFFSNLRSVELEDDGLSDFPGSLRRLVVENLPRAMREFGISNHRIMAVMSALGGKIE